MFITNHDIVDGSSCFFRMFNVKLKIAADLEWNSLKKNTICINLFLKYFGEDWKNGYWSIVI